MTKKVVAENILYNSRLTCPVCEKEILFRTLKSGKIRLLKTDLDLRPTYDLINPIFYEIAVCNNCGFAGLKKTLETISDRKIGLIKKNISSKFVKRTYPDIYDHDIAIERYKLAILNAMVIGSKESEKGYLCLKLAWIYRDYLEENLDIEEDIRKEYLAEEENYLKCARNSFKDAYSNENMPFMGLDEITVKYLIGELSRRLGDIDEASRWIGEVIVSRTNNKRLKEKALDCKELIKEEKNRGPQV